MVNQQAIKQVTEASLQREFVAGNVTLSGDYVADEVNEVMADFIKATDVGELFPWVHLDAHLYVKDAPTHFIWAVIKKLTSDPVPDLADATVWENLQKEGKLFAHGSGFAQVYEVTKTTANRIAETGYPKQLPDIQFHNVKLLPGESLHFCLMNKVANSTNGLTVEGVLQYRQTGV